MVTNIELPEDYYEDLGAIWTTLTLQQFDWQQPSVHAMTRAQAIMQSPPSAQDKVLVEDWQQELLGCTMQHLHVVGFIALTGALANGGSFDADWFAWPDLKAVLREVDLTPEQAATIYRRHFVQDRPQFRAALGQDASLPGPLRRFTFNPLLAHPFITGPYGPDLAPVPNAMLIKLSPRGFYQQGVDRWGGQFSTELGYKFEHYVGRQLHLLQTRQPDVIVEPEITYSVRGSTVKSVDWIVTTASTVVLIETKIAQPTQRLRTATPDPSLRRITHALDQIATTRDRIVERHPAFAHIPDDRDIVGMVVTLGDHYSLNESFVRDRLGLHPQMPITLEGVQVIEWAATAPDDFGQAVAHAAGAGLPLPKVDPHQVNPLLREVWAANLEKPIAQSLRRFRDMNRS